MSITAKASISLIIVHLLGFGILYAISDGASQWAGLPVPIWLFLGIYGLQWLVFVPSYLKQTEHYFDLTGTLTYILATVFAVLLTGEWHWVQMLLALMIVVWALRLGSFLFLRIRRDGKDGRFDALKPNPVRFLNVWSIQGLWVSLTLAAALTILTDASARTVHPFFWVGVVVWVVGFGIEVVADHQKSVFRRDPSNKEAFIQHGLWAFSRHPNYVGEIILWVGVAIIAIPELNGWQWLGLISPLFVVVLLSKISGVPLLEKRADEKWGGEPAYEAYKARTPVLFGFVSEKTKAADTA